MPSRTSPSDQSDSVPLGDDLAIQYFESLTLDEVRGVVRLMDQQTGIRESGFTSESALEDYRADIIRDIREGEYRGIGTSIMQHFPRHVIRRLGVASNTPGSARTNLTQRSPGANSLDYSRFDDIDTDDEWESDNEESEADAIFNTFSRGDTSLRTIGPADAEYRAQQIEMVRNASLDDLRRLALEFNGERDDLVDFTQSDEAMELIRTTMIQNIQSDSFSRSENSASSQTARPSAPRRPVAGSTSMGAGENLFLEADDAMFRKKIIDVRRNHPLPPRFLTATEVRAEIRNMVSAIFEDYHRLRGILERHEGTIQKRWAKKTKPQRLKVLLAAWPDMPVKHRPDLHAGRRAIQNNRVIYSKKDRDAYMWPHVNQEDLTKPKVLPIFLHARGYNLPYVFWEFDADSVSLSSRLGLLEEVFLNRHHMIFRNRTTPEDYGELVEFHSEAEAAALMRDRSLPPSSGLTTLAIQKRVMRFLVECCEHILHEIPPQDLLNHPILPVSAPTEMNRQAVTSLAELSLEGPYAVPDSIDLVRLKALCVAKRSAAEDHIWALREDPSYFLDTLRDTMDHRYEQVKDTYGLPHENLRSGRDGLIWASVVSNAVANAEWNLETWTTLCTTVDDVASEVAKVGGTVPQGQLPDELQFNLSYMKNFLEHAIRGPIAQLKASFYSSPPMRPYVEREEPETQRTRKTGICDCSLKGSTTVKKLFQTEGTPGELCWLIDMLTNENVRGELCAKQWGLTNVVDELGRLLQNESRLKPLISSRVAAIISDLGVFSEALRQMVGYEGQLFEGPILPHLDGKGNLIRGLTVPYFNFLDDIEGSKPGEYYKLCIPPTDGRFNYPSEKRRNKENHEAMRAAEQNLDAFWNKVDANLDVKRQKKREHMKTCDKGCDCGLDTATMKLLRQPRYMQRLGEWIEPGGRAAEHERQQHEADEAARRPLSEMYFDLQRRTERTVAKSHTHKHEGHTKAKTRGKPAPDKENTPPAAALPPGEQKDEQPVFEVDARAHKVFKTIFFTPSISSTPGEVPWLDFVHAMTATGFQAEKLYGSVWQFKPTRLDVERAILIHEPHPSGKIPYRICRNHGRRLNRAYGWTGDNFVLAGRAA